MKVLNKAGLSKDDFTESDSRNASSKSPASIKDFFTSSFTEQDLEDWEDDSFGQMEED